MRVVSVLGLASIISVLPAVNANAQAPADPKAQKTYNEALEYQHKHATRLAFDSFKKADKQDGGHCLPCQNEMVEDGIEFQEWNTAEAAASEIVSEAQGDKAIAIAHYGLGVVKMREGMAKRKDEFFSQAHDEFSRALASAANFPNAMYADGITLAHLKQDDAAKLRFEQFVRIKPEGDTDRQRALRYISNPELARARMAPAFAITTIDGQHLTLDDLKGKVVLIDFWAAWCPSCREAAAAHPKNCQDLCRPTSRCAEREFGFRRTKMERFCHQERDDMDSVSRRGLLRTRSRFIFSALNPPDFYHRRRRSVTRSAHRRRIDGRET